MSANYIIVKKVTEWLIAFLSLVILSPLFMVIMLLYVATAHAPVFFIQRRIGLHNKIFKLYKFRSLKNIDSPLHDRRFWLGDLLRYTSLDELPQIINVLKGDMSIVGPRPLPEEYLELFSYEQRQRHNVLPGITGLAQVSGRHALSWKEKFDLDIYYINNISFVLDFTILLKTIVLIFSFKKDVSLEEKRFTGNNNA